MVADVDAGYAEFIEYHEVQLKNIGLPEHAWRQVYEKLQPRTVEDVDTGLHVEGGTVVATLPHRPFSTVYIVPHKYSGDGRAGMFTSLQDNIHQPAAILDLMGYTEPRHQLTVSPAEQIDLVAEQAGCTHEVAEKCYSKCNGDIVYAIYMVNNGASRGAGDDFQKMLNIPDKPEIMTFDEFASVCSDERSRHRQLYNDYVVKKQQETGDAGSASTNKYKWVDDAEEHAITVTIPVPGGTTRANVVSKITRKHWTFGIRGQTPIIYGNFAGVVQPDECTWYFEKKSGNVIASIQKAESEVFLWENLIVGEDKLSEGWVSKERNRKICIALYEFWYTALTYQAITPEGKQAHDWFLPSRLVADMSHSDNPTFRLSPFWSCYGGKIITLLWPISTLHPGETCSLNRYTALFTGETELQRAARHWVCNPANTTVQSVPDSFTAQYEALHPPHRYCGEDAWMPVVENVVDLAAVSDHNLTIKTTMSLTEDHTSQLQKLGIEVSSSEGCYMWVEGREDRDVSQLVNGFDATLCNIIRLNEHIRGSFGTTAWWPAGYHINKELGALVAAPPPSPWETIWVVRCAEDSSLTFVTPHQPHIARMCENSLNYFAQPYVESLKVQDCQCSLEYTVVIRDGACWVSDTPSVHKARLTPAPDENVFCTDYFLPRSDGSRFPSVTWATFLVEYATRSGQPWPVQDQKIMQIFHDLLHSFVNKRNGCHCYGVQLIITPHEEIKLVGINPTPTYFPSLNHLAAAWRLLYGQSDKTLHGFRRI